jgi:hypothetical protein
MRRLLLVFSLAALGAAALATGAFAKEGGVELSSTPFGLGPGDPWNGTLTVFSEEGSNLDLVASPTITIRNLDTGETQTFAAKPAKVPTTETTQSFVFEAVFPTAGRYRYTVSDGVSDRQYDFPIVRIVGDSAVPIAGPPAGDTSGFPVWPLVGGLAGAAALALAVLAVRSRRFAH